MGWSGFCRSRSEGFADYRDAIDLDQRIATGMSLSEIDAVSSLPEPSVRAAPAAMKPTQAPNMDPSRKAAANVMEQPPQQLTPSYAGDWVTRLIRRRGEPAFSIRQFQILPHGDKGIGLGNQHLGQHSAGAFSCKFTQWIVNRLRLTQRDDSGISRHGVSLLSGGSGRLDTRLDTPPSINRRHPDSCLAH
jgi:hypothetical protein